MNLHQNKQEFIEIIEGASDFTGIPEEFIEKDYYVSLLLKGIVELCPDIVFKGGTSLSKCYKLIDRFSEDIDINFHNSINPNDRVKRNLKDSIVSAINNAELELTNGGEIRSRRDFNQYKVSFPSSVVPSGNLREHLLIESYVFFKSYPCEEMMVTSYILDFLEEVNLEYLIDRHNLKGFKMNVQRIERTLIDKIFAICDYFEKGQIIQNSRHLYDIHKIWSNNKFDQRHFLELFNEVASDRALKPSINISAEKGYEILNKLDEIISSRFYKDDYETITNSLLYSECSYNKTISSLEDIVNSGYLPNKIGQTL